MPGKTTYSPGSVRELESLTQIIYEVTINGNIAKEEAGQSAELQVYQIVKERYGDRVESVGPWSIINFNPWVFLIRAVIRQERVDFEEYLEKVNKELYG